MIRCIQNWFKVHVVAFERVRHPLKAVATSPRESETASELTPPHRERLEISCDVHQTTDPLQES